MRQSWRVRLRSHCQPNLGTSDSPLLPLGRECLCGSGAAPLFHYVEVAWAGVLWVIISSLVSSLTTFLVCPPQGKKSCQMRNKILQTAEAHPKSLKHPTTWTVCTHFQKLETESAEAATFRSSEAAPYKAQQEDLALTTADGTASQLCTHVLKALKPHNATSSWSPHGHQ